MSKARSDTRMGERPADLPEFANPPLVEVVIDTQFGAIPDYKQIHAAKVWALFKEEFPTVEEHPALLPSFETFGPPRQPRLNVKIAEHAMPARLWFVSKEGDHLIQFQPDRFIRNWRKHHAANTRYPRFEAVFDSFQSEFNKLDRYSRETFSHPLEINQCEVRYINHIPITKSEKFRTEDIFKFGDFGDFDIDDLHVRIQRTIRDEQNYPILRLGCECGIVPTRDRGVVVKFDVFARGAPRDASLEETLTFCLRAREEIVRFFTDITTEKAHQMWGRVQ